MPKRSLEERIERRRITNQRTARESRERAKAHLQYLIDSQEKLKDEISELNGLLISLALKQCQLNILCTTLTKVLIDEITQPEYEYTGSGIFSLPKYDYTKTLAENFYFAQNSFRS